MWLFNTGFQRSLRTTSTGGSTPGSMPPQSTSLAEEGAASEGFKVVCGGAFDAAAVEKFLSDPAKVRRGVGVGVLLVVRVCWL